VAAALAQNSATAYGELVRRHQSQVRGLLRRLCRDTTLADDLAQDAFLHAWRKLHSFTGRGSFVGWLLKIAYTTFLQAKRKSKRYQEVLALAAGDARAVRHEQSNFDEVGDLDKVLAVLDEDEQRLLVLSFGCGFSHREIAELCGLPLGTVKSLIFRCRAKLKDELETMEQASVAAKTTRNAEVET